jgi:hypothetical protein
MVHANTLPCRTFFGSRRAAAHEAAGTRSPPCTTCPRSRGRCARAPSPFLRAQSSCPLLRCFDCASIMVFARCGYGVRHGAVAWWRFGRVGGALTRGCPCLPPSAPGGKGRARLQAELRVGGEPAAAAAPPAAGQAGGDLRLQQPRADAAEARRERETEAPEAAETAARDELGRERRRRASHRERKRGKPAATFTSPPLP